MMTITEAERGNQLYRTVTGRMPVTLPPLDRATLDAVLGSLGATPDTVTGAQMEQALRGLILPNISRWVAEREAYPFRAGLIVTDARNRIVTLNANAAVILGLPADADLTGMSVADLPAVAPCVPTIEALGDDDVRVTEYDLTTAERRLQCLSTLRRDASGMPIGVSTTVQDTTMQTAIIAEVDRLYHASERRVRELTALGEIGRLIALANSLDDTLALIAEKTTRTLGCRAAAIFLPDGAGRLMMRGQYGQPDAYVPIINAALAEFAETDSEYVPPTLVAFREGKMAFADMRVITPEMPEVLRVTRDIGEASGWAAIAAVPLIAQGEIMGTLTCYLDEPQSLSADETRLLTAIAGQTAISVRNRILTTETQRQLEEMRALHESAARLNSSLDRDAVLHLIVEQAAKLTHARVAILAELVEGSDLLVARAAYSRDDTLKRDFARYMDGFGLPVFRDGPAVHAIRARQPVVVRDRHEVVEQPWYNAEMAERWHDPNAMDMQALIAMPFGYEEQYDAALMLIYDRAINPAEGEMQLLGAFADHAAVALHNTRLYAQAQQAAALEERHRLARDLHDSVTQSLFSMSLLAQAIPPLFAINPQEATNSLGELQRLSKEALAEMRALLFQLRPVALEADGLVEALTKQVASLQRRDGPELRFTCNNCDERLPHAVEDALFRVATEAVNNALKHSHAKVIAVHIEQEADIVTLSVRDDGTGFDLTTQHTEPGHLGLAGMRERVSRTGGVFTIESAPGKGTAVTVRVAAPAAANAG